MIAAVDCRTNYEKRWAFNVVIDPKRWSCISEAGVNVLAAAQGNFDGG